MATVYLGNIHREKHFTSLSWGAYDPESSNQQSQSEHGRAPFHFFVTPMDLIQTAALFQRICASCGHLKCEHSRQGCFFNVGIGKCNFHAFAKCNVKKEDHARFGMVSGYYCQIGHWQGGQWL